MTNTVISVETVGKLSRLGTLSRNSLARDLNRACARRRGKPGSLAKIGQENDQRSNVLTSERSNDEIIELQPHVNRNLTNSYNSSSS